MLNFLKRIKLVRSIARLIKLKILIVLNVQTKIEQLEQENKELQQACQHWHIEYQKQRVEFQQQQIQYKQALTTSEQWKTNSYFQASHAELLKKTMNHLISLLPNIENGPLISIIMPIWNRAALVTKAIESVIAQTYPFWELIIVDDGSTDSTKDVISSYLSDKRIHYFYQTHQGSSTARNFGIQNSSGDWIAYLDSDNVWYPYVLSLIIQHFLTNTTSKAAYFGAIWENHINNNKWIHFPIKLNYEDIILSQKDEIGEIDLNCFVHHRKLNKDWGGFDTNLSRLIDFELIYRYLKQTHITPLPFVGTHYNFGLASNTITMNMNCWYNLYKIRKKYQQPINSPCLRVLYITDHYPQVTESYIYTELEWMQRQGVEIEVWSNHSPASPFSTLITIHRGNLEDAILKFKPDLVHAHWLTAINQADIVKKYGLTMTVRGHGYEFNSERVTSLNNHPSCHTIYLFPHLYKKHAKECLKLKSLPACFSSKRYFPQKEKNKKMVLRVSAALPTKDLFSFIDVAKKCRDHHFVLIVASCRNIGNPIHEIELQEYNAAQGYPIDLRINLMPEEVSVIMQEAGIYFHTVSLPGATHWTPIGMPISICEAMATGAYLIARDEEPIKNYIGLAGDFYHTNEEAQNFINATLNWSDDDWKKRQQLSIDQAYHYYLDDLVLPTILNDWKTIKSNCRLKKNNQTLVMEINEF